MRVNTCVNTNKFIFHAVKLTAQHISIDMNISRIRQLNSFKHNTQYNTLCIFSCQLILLIGPHNSLIYELYLMWNNKHISCVFLLIRGCCEHGCHYQCQQPGKTHFQYAFGWSGTLNLNHPIITFYTANKTIMPTC